MSHTATAMFGCQGHTTTLLHTLLAWLDALWLFSLNYFTDIFYTYIGKTSHTIGEPLG